MPAWTGSSALELFIISLDNRREWYRYHHLFQELLQQSLMAEMALMVCKLCIAGRLSGSKSMA